MESTIVICFSPHHFSISRQSKSVALLVALTLYFLPDMAYADDGLFTKPLDALTAYQQRPLFSPQRRLQTVTPTNEVTPQPVAGQALNATLLGLISTNEGTGLAILRIEGQPETVRIHVGETIEGWQLDAIDSHHAIFSSGDEKITLTFPNGKLDDKTDSVISAAPDGTEITAPIMAPKTNNP